MLHITAERSNSSLLSATINVKNYLKLMLQTVKPFKINRLLSEKEKEIRAYTLITHVFVPLMVHLHRDTFVFRSNVYTFLPTFKSDHLKCMTLF